MRRLILLVAFTVNALFLSMTALGAPKYYLDAFDVSSDSIQDTLSFAINSRYEEIPILEYETGLARIILPDTGFSPDLNRLTVNNRFIQMVTLQEEMQNAVLEIQFANIDLQPVGRVSYQNTANQFLVVIQKKKVEPEGIEVEPTLAESGFLGREDASGLADYFTETDFTQNVVKSVIALFIILLLIYLLIWLFRKLFGTRFRLINERYSIKVSSSYHISPKQKIMIVEVNELAFALGVTANQISLISQISRETFAESMRQMDLPQKKAIDFAEIRNQYLNKKRENEKSNLEQASPRQNFATELISRVKKLRPLD